jgi:sulfur carrier protein ThiS
VQTAGDNLDQFDNSRLAVSINFTIVAVLNWAQDHITEKISLIQLITDETSAGARDMHLIL